MHKTGDGRDVIVISGNRSVADCWTTFRSATESIIVLAKLMLPHVFEKMSMPYLRILIAEKSMVNIYLRGESFELLHLSVGFLLEGYIKIQGGQEEVSPETIDESSDSCLVQMFFIRRLLRFLRETSKVHDVQIITEHPPVRSRPGCQIIAEPEFEGLRLALPSATLSLVSEGLLNPLLVSD